MRKRRITAEYKKGWKSLHFTFFDLIGIHTARELLKKGGESRNFLFTPNTNTFKFMDFFRFGMFFFFYSCGCPV